MQYFEEMALGGLATAMLALGSTIMAMQIVLI